MSWFDSITSKIQSNIPSNFPDLPSNLIPSNEILDALTLRTPELAAEREQIDQEEGRKEQVRDCLAELLPWETHDEERTILSEECKELILDLSRKEETFTGSSRAKSNADEKEETSTTESTPNSSEEEPEDIDPATLLSNAIKARRLAEGGDRPEASPGLVPPLLELFDLDAHVGLIGRVLEVDHHLVEMHAALSGGRVKEVTFWKNYFLHCALARVEVGLGLDEIWGTLLPTKEQLMSRGSSRAAEEEILFDEGSSALSTSESKEPLATSTPALLPALVLPSGIASTTTAANMTKTQTVPSSNSSSPPSDYEIVSNGVDIDADVNVDAEISDDIADDDLDAEIARELAELES
mmetsp:Transcript_46422/g.68579  ORF Transcript_46422/g.68579 Transcript_46422/m.68579 type:complete len:353 (+) Transcript_46422:153-1211(+)|eukprot:CAMPEP_0195530686 /NCGR_PEP_ID=MMETSP0794_2-20130614/33693_1 /TAXON_ID=515487 /ORGANISM="Stephanopyxis turris, Strain CCMP 815" /LENGTH=352 /DNA_ID=CAMNT_0040662243 /DNA_START=132 /DNA_END=1190 /DNA_ORIENTATION=+